MHRCQINPNTTSTHSTGISRRRLVGVTAATIALAGFSGSAKAHAVIVESTPKSGEALAMRDLAIRLRFNSRIDLRRSRLVLVAPDRKERSLTLLPESTADTLVARSAELVLGAYRLRWQVLAIDGHITRGDINFSVRPANV